MIVSNLNLESKSKHIILSADIQYDRGKKKNTIYFKIEDKFSDFIAKDYSPFFAISVLASMQIGENLEIAGSISRKLLYGAAINQTVFLKWNSSLKIIKNNISTVVDKFNSKEIACFFSGGVDSFCTVIRNNRDEQKIKYLIFVHGFDIELKNKELFENTLRNIKAFAENNGFIVISVETNLRHFTDDFTSWDFAHGPAMASVGLFLRKKIKSAYIPSSYQSSQLFPWGSHPDLDKNWSTETIKFIHDGSDLSRLDKVFKYVSNSPEALKYLRVCWKNVNGKYNCGKCNKCMRTMIELEVAGVLSRCKTFPNNLDYENVENLHSSGRGSVIFINEIIAYLNIKGINPELVSSLKKSLIKSKNPNLKIKIISNLGKMDKKYNRGRLYLFLSKIGKI